MTTTAKEKAITDIRKSLKKDSKCFITFRSELNPVMDKLVSDYIKTQQNITR